MSATFTPRFAITTPDRVTFYHQPAELPTRAMAWFIDQALLLVLKIAFLFALSRLLAYGIAIFFVVLLLLDFGYFTWFEWKRQGQTPGKKTMRIRVVSATGAMLKPEDVFLRNLLRPIDSLPFTNVVGALIAYIDPHRRRLGDLVGGTLVIHDVSAALPDAVFDSGRRDNTFWNDLTLRQRILAKVSRDERDLLMDLTQRRDGIETLAREELFARAATYFRARYNLPETEHLTDEQTVINIALVACAPQKPGLGSTQSRASQS